MRRTFRCPSSFGARCTWCCSSPIHAIVAERDLWRERGFDLPIHVDAAWGGYLTSLFREPDGSFAERKEIRQRFQHFPSKTVYEAFRALPEADSITVDARVVNDVNAIVDPDSQDQR